MLSRRSRRFMRLWPRGIAPAPDCSHRSSIHCWTDCLRAARRLGLIATCTDRKLRFRRRERRPPMPAVHSPLTVSNLSRDRYAQSRQRLPVPSRRATSSHVAAWGQASGAARVCECAPRLYGIQRLRHLPTYTASECVRRAVIIIISRLIIVIRSRRRRSLSPADKRYTRRDVALLDSRAFYAIVTRRESSFVCRGREPRCRVTVRLDCDCTNRSTRYFVV